MNRLTKWLTVAALLIFGGQGDNACADDLAMQVQATTEQIEREISQARSQIEIGKTREALEALTNASHLVDKLPLSTTSGRYTGAPGYQLRIYRTKIGNLLVGLDDKFAESEFQKAIAVPEVFGDKGGLADAESALANLKEKQGKTSESSTLKSRALCIKKITAAGQASSAYEQEWLARNAIDAAKGPPAQEDLLLQAYLWLGRAYEGQNRFVEAEKAHKDRLALAQKMNSQVEAAESVLDLGMLSENTGNYAQAEKYFRDSASMFEKLGRKDSYSHQRLSYFLTYKKEGTLDARKFMNRGHNLRRLNKFAEADKEFRNALSLAKKANNREVAISALTMLQEVNKYLNNQGIAHEFAKQEAALRSKPK